MWKCFKMIYDKRVSLKYNCFSHFFFFLFFDRRDFILFYFTLRFTCVFWEREREREQERGRDRRRERIPSIPAWGSIPGLWDHDLSWNRESDTQMTEPANCLTRDFNGVLYSHCLPNPAFVISEKNKKRWNHYLQTAHEMF